jgi:hypothetical protein
MATARRAPPARPSAGPVRRAAAPAAAPRSSGYTGAEGYAKMREEELRQEARKEAREAMAEMPFRFYCPTGESREICVIDAEPTFWRYEHNLRNPDSGKYDIYTACINDHAACPVCKNSDRAPYFAMLLTIIDLTPYVNRNDEEVPWSKKLLCVKPAQQKKIMRLFEREGSLRGMVLNMTRDGDKDASIGNDIEFVEFLDEDTLAQYETTYFDKKDKEHVVIGHEVFDYDELFPMPTEEQLRAIVGGKPEPGSRSHDRAALRGGTGRGRGDDAGDGWDRGAERAAPASRRGPPVRQAVTPAGRTAMTRRAVAPAADDPVEDVEDRPVVRRPVGRAAPAAPASRAPVRRAAPVEDDAPQRPATRAPVRRAAPVAEPEEEAPVRAAGSLAARRAALRR